MPNIEKLRKANMNQAYPKEVNDEMGKRHPYGDELALIRKAVYAIGTGQPLPQEFVNYHFEAEAVKTYTRANFPQES